uniref:KAP NTPase domain-containing protein n=1 Tax=termite gut metagenome TaxID=433724 RepID=S0DEU2_9ZZZZ
MGLVKRVGYMVADNTLGGTNAGDIRDALDSPHEETRSVNEIIRDLKENFQKCVYDALADEGRTSNEEDRVVIFIDDLDRLPPVRAVEILEVFKNFIDCKKCVFVLAIDYNVVVSGVKGKYGTDIDEGKGRNFFDKIIQVPFRMPMAQYDISNFIKETLEEAAGIKCSDAEAKEYTALISTSTGSNPRSMKRLFNSFLLQKMVVGDDLLKTGRDEKVLFALLCMQQRFGNLYDYVVLNRDDDIANIFSRVASSETPESVLETLSGFEAQGEEASEIQAFVKKFNLALMSGTNKTVLESETDVSSEQWDCIKPLLDISAVTATETVTRSVKTRRPFEYKGKIYKSRGKGGLNLSFLALRLIKDYAKEKAQDSTEWIDRVNGEIPLHSANSKYSGLDSIIERSNYLLNQDGNIQRYHHAENQIIRLGDKEYLVATEWAQEWVETLIDILGYTEQINR